MRPGFVFGVVVALVGPENSVFLEESDQHIEVAIVAHSACARSKRRWR